MEIVIKGDPTEIAALVRKIQEQQTPQEKLHTKMVDDQLYVAIRNPYESHFHYERAARRQ